MALARIADTSWLYAIFNHEDAFHQQSESELLEPRPTLVPSAIMNELLDLVKYRVSKQAATRTEEALRGFPHFDLWYPVDKQAALAVWKDHPALSLADAHAVACARATGFALATFDERQKAALGD